MMLAVKYNLLFVIAFVLPRIGYAQRFDTAIVREISKKLDESSIGNNHPDSLLLLASQGLEIATSIKDKVGTADMHKHIGRLNMVKGDIAKSLESYTFSKAIYDELDMKVQSTNVLISLGRVYRNLGDYNKAIDYYYQALEFFERQNDNKNLALVTNSLGIVYSEFGDYPSATTMFKRTMTLNQVYLSDALTNLGNVYFMMNDLDSAAFFQQQAIELSEQENDFHGIAVNNCNLGEIMLLKGNYNKALNYLRQSEKISREKNYKEAHLFALTTIGRIRIKQKDFLKAEASLLEALKIARKAQISGRLIEIYQWLSVCYREMGNLANALYYSDRFVHLKDSVYNKENAAKLSNLLVIHEVDSKTAKINLLEKDRSIAELSRNLTVAIAVGIVLLASLAIFRYKQRLRDGEIKFQKKAKERLEQEVKQRTEEITKKNKELEAINNIKDKLFSIISHDLKGPLNSLKGALHIFKMDAIKEDEFKGLACDIGVQLNNTTEFLENLLQWAKSQMQGLIIKPENLNLLKLTSDISKLLEFEFERKKISFQIEIEPELQVYADPIMVQTVLRNLVSNSLKFSRPGDLVRVVAKNIGKQITIFVSDTGVGMDNNHLNKLFTFQGITTAGTNEEKGTGIGLLLCKEFVERNNGTIQVTSKKDIGTTIQITLPVIKVLTSSVNPSYGLLKSSVSPQ